MKSMRDSLLLQSPNPVTSSNAFISALPPSSLGCIWLITLGIGCRDSARALSAMARNKGNNLCEMLFFHLSFSIAFTSRYDSPQLERPARPALPHIWRYCTTLSDSFPMFRVRISTQPAGKLTPAARVLVAKNMSRHVHNTPMGHQYRKHGST